MKTAILFLSLVLCLPIHASETLTVERIFSSPELEGSTPQGLKFSPDGKRLSFLQGKKDDYETLDLWEYDLNTGKPRLLVDSKTLKFGELSEAEKARRERMRISRKGIVEYLWSEDSNKIVFPAGGDLYLYVFGSPLKRLTQNPAAEIDVKFSPKDSYLSFARDQNLYVLDVKSGREFAVTTQGKNDLTYGMADFIAQEEMDRDTGYWWSKDESMLALTEVDESPVKWVDRYEINADSVTTIKQRYPEAGGANAKVRLAVVRLDSVRNGKPELKWVPLPAGDIYLARVEWTAGHKLAYQVESRDQKTLDVYFYDPVTGANRKVLTEKDKYWINLNNDWRFLENGNWIWASERGGYKHLYLYDGNGKLIRALTKGEWPVDELEGVDEKDGWVYFSGWIKTPLERHLYRVPLNAAAEPVQLTHEETMNRPEMDRKARFFVNRFSKSRQPSQVTLNKADGTRIATLSANEVKEGHPLFPYRDSLLEPEYGSFKNKSGDTIYYSLVKPKNFDPKKKYPLIVSGYGGPGVQTVGKGWGGRWELFSDILAGKGFVVATFDNRGSSRRGRKFENWLYRAFGTVEIEDQKAGVEYLVKQGFIDPARVGFSGWSYGGYLAMMLAAKAPETFAAVAAGAPVTDPALYDTHYTERYMGKPQEEKKAYARANVLNFVPNIKGRVLVLHGMADDNVLFTNSTMLYKRMQEEGKLFESVNYPGAKHGVYGRKNQIHVYKSIADFFERHLLRQ